MKFLHCADLHLDSAMESRFSTECARIRRQELLLCFGRIAEVARGEGVRAVLIAGDLFDTAHPAPSAVRYVLDTIASFAQIDFLMLYGNHAGSFRFGENIPANLKFFGESSYTGYRYGKVCIYGCENPQTPLPKLDPAACNIVMLHGQITESGHGADNVTLADLRGRGIDYLALGHLHTQRAERLDDRGVLCYAGCPEGRGFDEAGDKGVVLVSEDDGHLSQSVLYTAKRLFRILPVDISECPSQRKIEEAILSAVEQCSADDCLRVCLSGSREAGFAPDLPGCQAAIAGRFFYSEVRDDTVFSLSPESYEHDLSLRGEFVRTVLRHNHDEAEADRILTAGLAALAGEEVSL